MKFHNCHHANGWFEYRQRHFISFFLQICPPASKTALRSDVLRISCHNIEPISNSFEHMFIKQSVHLWPKRECNRRLLEPHAFATCQAKTKKMDCFCSQLLQQQGRSHSFKSGGAQATKIIWGPFYLKSRGGQTLLLL